MSLPVVVSAYTIDTPYDAMAQRLRASCDRLGLSHHIVGYPSRGSWEANTAAKAGFCRSAWRALGVPILWVDADAVLHGTPELLRDATVDFAVHKWKGQYFASGTVFFNGTPAAGALLAGWEQRCADLSEIDQVHLEREWQALARTGPTVKTLLLPRSYCQIFDSPRIDGDPVIEHFQASRAERPQELLA